MTKVHLTFIFYPDGNLTLNGGFERRIRTSLGEFKMDFWRVRCSKCGKKFAPLAQFIGLERYQTKLVVEAVSGTNYRRAVKDLERDGKFPVSFHTAHGWVMRSDCDEIKLSPKTVGSAPLQIMPDGTEVKGAGNGGQARKGDLKAVIGISSKATFFRWRPKPAQRGKRLPTTGTGIQSNSKMAV